MSIVELRAGTLLTVSDLAERLLVSDSAIERWVATGHRKPCGALVRLKALRIGRSLRFHPAAVDAFLRACEGEATDTSASTSA